MNEDSKVMDIIVEELTEAKNKHAVPRRTMIKPDEGDNVVLFFVFDLLFELTLPPGEFLW